MSMRKIKEVLRLRFELRLGQREIARACSISQGAVHNYVKKATAAGIGWPLPEDWDEKRIEETLFGHRHPIERRQRALPDFPSLHEQFQQHRHLTLQLAWEEYRQVHPEGYGYSRFCELYGRWLRKLDVVLRQKHGPGEKGFVDWAGKTVPIQDSQTGEIRGATLFVMVLGASSYTYAEATLEQQMAVWLRCHIHAFEYFQGVPRLLVPDNTRTAVSRACRYENVERAAMLPLPAEPFDMSQWLLRTSRHRRPHQLRSQLLQRVIPPDWRTGRSSTPTTVEIFHKGKRVASHPRGRGREQAITQNEHRPKSHQEWTPKRMVHWAEQIGPNTARLIERIL
jgi:transposase